MSSALLPCAALAAATLFLGGKAGYKLEPLKEPPPAEAAAPVKEALSGEGFRVVDPKGKPLVDLWLRKSVPAAAAASGNAPPGVKFDAMAEGSLLAIARYHQKHYDYKSKPIPPGVYTLRHGIQPNDGDHLGVSDTRDFALLCPVAADKDLAPLPTDQSVKLSCQVSGTKHPSVVWLTPMQEPRKEFPALVAQSDREYQVLDFQVHIEGEKEKAIRFGLVVVGTAPES